jgi:hypothetical protein
MLGISFAGLAVVHILFLITLAGTPGGMAAFPLQFRLFPCLSLFSVEVPFSGFTGFTALVHLAAVLVLPVLLCSSVFRIQSGRKRTKLVEAIELLLQEDGELMCSADWVFVREHFSTRNLGILFKELKKMKKLNDGENVTP